MLGFCSAFQIQKQFTIMDQHVLHVQNNPASGMYISSSQKVFDTCFVDFVAHKYSSNEVLKLPSNNILLAVVFFVIFRKLRILDNPCFTQKKFTCFCEFKLLHPNTGRSCLQFLSHTVLPPTLFTFVYIHWQGLHLRRRYF